MRHVLRHAYAHHIERLMVLGLFSLLFGCHPRKFHEWHMAMYADAIDWVSLPNTLGMSQYGDGGLVGTKPYCATGNYINRMSNYCGRCRYDYRQAAGNTACPFTTLYWDFLDRRQERLKNNRRMQIQLQNLVEKRHDARAFLEIRRRAEQLRRNWSEILVHEE
jgi:deoxyribodipyrimidine photolyase-related protein